MIDKTVEDLSHELYELRQFIYALKMHFRFNKTQRYSGLQVENEMSRFEIEYERNRAYLESKS